MVRSFALGYRFLGDATYRHAAERAAEFLWATMRRPDGTLWHSYRNGIAKVDGMLDDYAFLLVALSELHEATDESKWLERAKVVADTMLRLFWDDNEGGFWFTTQRKDLLARSKPAIDGAEPSPNGMATLGLLRLANATKDDHYAQIAQRTLSAFGGLMVRVPRGAMTLLIALDEWRATRKEAIAPMERPIERIWTEPDRLRLQAGETVSLKVHLALAKGWHINSVEPQPNLQPTTLSGESRLVTIERVEAPTAKEVRLSFADVPLRVYEGTVTFVLWLRPKPDAQGDDVLTLRLRFQACDDRRCLAPAELTLKVPLTVVP
jgi:hypothetical protein